MKPVYFSSIFLLVLSISSFAQKKMSCAEWLSTSDLLNKMSWIKNAVFHINNKTATYDDADTLNFTGIGKIEVYAKKQAIAEFGKDEGSKGVVVIETRKVAQRNDLITINDSIKYYIEGIDTVYTKAEQMGKFGGENAQWIKFLQRNLNADVPTENGAPPGIYSSLIAFVVNEDGSVSNARIVYDPGWGTGKESLRIIQQSNSLWQPSMQNGKAVKSVLLQSITFQVMEG